MSNVVSFRPFVGLASPPTLVLVDLQRGHVADFRAPDAIEALANCRAALAHARACGFPVAFVRWSERSPDPRRLAPRSHWIEGFEPMRTDMVFERNRPSCYASPAFAEVMANDQGHFVLAGFAGEGACLATAIDAYHRGHRVTFLSDASASRTLGDVAASDVHRTVCRVIGCYGEAIPTKAWIAATRRGERRLGRSHENEHERTAQ